MVLFNQKDCSMKVDATIIVEWKWWHANMNKLVDVDNQDWEQNMKAKKPTIRLISYHHVTKKYSEG
jgi:hypothetical protein